jgi:phospholipase C
VAAGDRIKDEWPLHDFDNDLYFLRVYGPNGFFREFRGDVNDPQLDIALTYHRENKNRSKPAGDAAIVLTNNGHGDLTILIRDISYHTPDIRKKLPMSNNIMIPIDLSRSFGWYDFTVSIEGNDQFIRRYAGRVENGKAGFTDPAMGNLK